MAKFWINKQTLTVLFSSGHERVYEIGADCEYTQLAYWEDRDRREWELTGPNGRVTIRHVSVAQARQDFHEPVVENYDPRYTERKIVDDDKPSIFKQKERGLFGGGL